MLLLKLLLIAVAGGLGALARYWLSGVIANRLPESGFNWGTACVNLLGCLVFGVLYALMESRLSISPEARTVTLVGFMGAFTTFSTFAFDTAVLMQDARWLLVGGNLLLQNGVGIAALLLGLAIGRLV